MRSIDVEEMRKQLMQFSKDELITELIAALIELTTSRSLQLPSEIPEIINFVASQRQPDIDPELRDKIVNKLSTMFVSHAAELLGGR